MPRKWLNAAGIAVLLTIVALAMSQAGPLEPSAPPGPTMKTLDEIPPTWSLILPPEQRYVVVMNGEAVLDKETGLVWERAPFVALQDWDSAFGFCLSRRTGDRGGWRLPSIAELLSLAAELSRLPASSPFDFDCSDNRCIGFDQFYWSATTVSGLPERAHFWDPNAGAGHGSKTATRPTLCVRGGFGSDSGR